MDEKSVYRFWQHVLQLPPWQDHPGPHGVSEEDLSKTIAFCGHADGAEMYTNSEYFVWSWTSAFGTGGMCKDVMLSRYPICFISEFQMQTDAVTRQIWQSAVGIVRSVSFLLSTLALVLRFAVKSTAQLQSYWLGVFGCLQAALDPRLAFTESLSGNPLSVRSLLENRWQAATGALTSIVMAFKYTEKVGL